MERVNISRTTMVVAMAICLAEAAKFPHHDPGTAATVVMGILLLRRVLTVFQPAAVVISGCVLTAIIILGDQGKVDIERHLWFWFPVIIVAFVIFGFWERIERLWKHANNVPSKSGMV